MYGWSQTLSILIIINPKVCEGIHFMHDIDDVVKSIAGVVREAVKSIGLVKHVELI